MHDMHNLQPNQLRRSRGVSEVLQALAGIGSITNIFQRTVIDSRTYTQKYGFSSASVIQ